MTQTPRPFIPASAPVATPKSPFDLGDDAVYGAWRRAKLDGYPERTEQLVVPVADIAHPTAAEVATILALCAKTNMAIYRSGSDSNTSRDAVKTLGGDLGLHRLDPNPSAGDDHLTALSAKPGVPGHDYIPHTDKPLNWHTDGYYNPPDRRVRAMTLHCVRAAAEGGANTLLDPEIAYIRLRDDTPDHIAALMRPDAMTIPANVRDGREIRPAQSGPVFSIDPATARLHTRYTARTRSIQWRQDRATAAAVRALERILATAMVSADAGAAPEPPGTSGTRAFHYRLAPGEGIVCNNVFHRRDRFYDPPAPAPGRLMLRGRYYDCVGGVIVPASPVGTRLQGGRK